MNFSNILNIKQAMTKVLKKKCWLVFFVFYFNLFQGLQGQVYHHITDAGAWCWFSDPRAIYLHGKETSVLTGWVKEDGSIEAARINLKTKEIQKQILFNQLEKMITIILPFLNLQIMDTLRFMPNMGVEIFIIIEIQKKRINYLERLPFLIPLVKRSLKNFPEGRSLMPILYNYQMKTIGYIVSEGGLDTSRT